MLFLVIGVPLTSLKQPLNHLLNTIKYNTNSTILQPARRSERCQRSGRCAVLETLLVEPSPPGPPASEAPPAHPATRPLQPKYHSLLTMRMALGEGPEVEGIFGRSGILNPPPQPEIHTLHNTTTTSL